MTRQLNIGGTEKKDGWETFDIKEGADHVGNAKDLSRFDDGIFDVLYASHVLEHFDFTGSLQQALEEWYRVLKPNGELYISVPDMKVLCELFNRAQNVQSCFAISRMMFGGHCDKDDYHYAGLSFDILGQFLNKAGFSSMKKVDTFDIFQDTSNLRVSDILISLNVIVQKGVRDEIVPLETSL